MGVSRFHPVAAVSLLLLLFVTRCCAHETPRVQGSSRVRVTTEAGLVEAFNQLEMGQSILLELEEINLNETLVIDVPGISITGNLDRRTIIRCPRNREESAMIIRAGETQIDFVEFNGCRDHSAVVVDRNTGQDDDHLVVTFLRVDFIRNGDARAFIYGGAVRSGRCRKDHCPHGVLKFTSCFFSQNRASYGGALYLEDSDLHVRDSSFIQNEADLSGGAIYAHNMTQALLTIDQTKFEENIAHGDKKVHRSEESILLETSNQTLATAGMGGAMFLHCPLVALVSGSTFKQNQGCRGAGGIGVVHDGDATGNDIVFGFTVKDSRFEENSAYCVAESDALRRLNHIRGTGGALMSTSLGFTTLEWYLTNSTFIANRGTRGGAVYVSSTIFSEAAHNIEQCTFDHNAAVTYGGALASVSAHLVIAETRISNCRAVYGAGIMAWTDATLDIVSDPDDPAALSIIENCTSYYGAGIHAALTHKVNLTALVVRNNTALRSGGGLEINNIGDPVALRGVRVENNRAMLGGGIALMSLMNFTITSDDYGNPAVIKDNVACTAAGLYIEPGHEVFFSVVVENATFEGNEVLTLEDDAMKDLNWQTDDHILIPDTGMHVPDITEQLGNVSVLDFLSTVQEGHGGAICVAAESLELFNVAEIIFRNLYVAENKATVGGGMSIHLSELHWNRGDGKSCFPAAFGLDSCQRLVFVNVTVTKNKADYAGGVFSTLPDGISVSCSADDDVSFPNMGALFKKQPHEDDFLKDHCSSVIGNELSDGASHGGGDLGTRAVHLAVEGWNGPLNEVASGDYISLPCEENASNASCSRQLRVSVKDAFDQTIVRGIEDSHLDLVLFSDAISGTLRYTAENGIAVINNTVAQGINRSSTLTIMHEHNRNVKVELDLSTRECHPGESIQGHMCNQCPRDQYGFHPKLNCSACEKNAYCPGEAVLVPLDGHWHSNPFSPVIRTCILKSACTFEDRREILSSFYENSTKVQEALSLLDASIRDGGTRPEYEDYQQCADGYEGFLCGSCSDGYGHSLTRSCKKCSGGHSTSGLFIIMAMSWTFLLIGINCLVTLLSMNTRVQLVRHELRSQSLKRRTSFLGAIPSTRASRSSLLLSPNSSRSHCSLRLKDFAGSRLLVKELVASVQLTETLKILMNYLQVTSTALQLQTDWHSLLNILLSKEAFLAGFFDEVWSVPFECNFGRWSTPPAISSLWMRLAIPWIVLFSLLLTFVFVWLVMRYKCQSKVQSSSTTNMFTRQRLVTGLIVISIVSIYFSYIDFVRELLRTVNCMSVKSSDGLVMQNHNYVSYALEADDRRIWAEDTDIICFKGAHLPVGVVGILGLLLSAAGILFIIFWLPINRTHVTETEFVARYWFLYQAYKKKWYTVAWESTILVRKSLIVAVAVFGVPLGASLQAALCVGILVTCQALHSLLAPFKVPEDHEYVPEYPGMFRNVPILNDFISGWVRLQNKIHLNHLESVSLISSVVVFLTGIILHDPNVSLFGRRALAIFAFVLNLCFLVFMIFRLYAGCHVLIDLKLETKNPEFIEEYKQTMGLHSLIAKLFVWIRAYRSPNISIPRDLEGQT